MPTIYVLLCEKKRYYVGKTERPLKCRIEEHFNKRGSQWTKKYKPIKLIEQIPNADEFDEDKYTKKYMKKYGIDKVRGGTYTQLDLPDYSRLALEKELCSASDLCFRCNRPGHFVGQCYAVTKKDGSPIDEEEDSDEEEEDSDEYEEDSSDEYEEYWSCEYCSKEFDSEYAANKHEKLCKGSNKKQSLSKQFNTALKIAEQLQEDKAKPKKQICFRCGRAGHYSNDCYASSNISGKKLY